MRPPVRPPVAAVQPPPPAGARHAERDGSSSVSRHAVPSGQTLDAGKQRVVHTASDAPSGVAHIPLAQSKAEAHGVPNAPGLGPACTQCPSAQARPAAQSPSAAQVVAQNESPGASAAGKHVPSAQFSS